MADPMIREALSEADDVRGRDSAASELLSSHTHASPPMESYSKDGTVTEKRVYLDGENVHCQPSAGGDYRGRENRGQTPALVPHRRVS